MAVGCPSIMRSSNSPNGFEWTYEGASLRQLALAILYDHLGDKDRAIALSEPFMQRVIADFDNDWTLTGEEVERAIKDMH
jgi:hypothetical protein